MKLLKGFRPCSDLPLQNVAEVIIFNGWSLGFKMIAQVCINYQDANVDKVFDYLVPTHLENSIEIGKRVYVSFGVSNRIVEGLVVGIKQTTDIEENKIKCVLAVIDKFSIVSKEQIELAFSMKNYYALNLGEALSLVIPPFVSSNRYIISVQKSVKKIRT